MKEAYRLRALLELRARELDEAQQALAVAREMLLAAEQKCLSLNERRAQMVQETEHENQRIGSGPVHARSGEQLRFFQNKQREKLHRLDIELHEVGLLCEENRHRVERAEGHVAHCYRERESVQKHHDEWFEMQRNIAIAKEEDVAEELVQPKKGF